MTAPMRIFPRTITSLAVCRNSIRVALKASSSAAGDSIVNKSNAPPKHHDVMPHSAMLPYPYVRSRCFSTLLQCMPRAADVDRTKVGARSFSTDMTNRRKKEMPPPASDRVPVRNKRYTFLPQILPMAPNYTVEEGKRSTKVKPSIVKRRISKLRTYIGQEKNIRHSPWRLNLVCQFAAGQTVNEAIHQLHFCHKSKAPLVKKVIRRTSNLADIRHGLLPSQLEVAECFATHGTHLKRIQIMARGRSGKKLRRFSHIRLVLREIDFPLKIVQATNDHQKERWRTKQRIAEEDQRKSRAERGEFDALEKESVERTKATENATK